jgi:hypothetical protein
MASIDTCSAERVVGRSDPGSRDHFVAALFRLDELVTAFSAPRDVRMSSFIMPERRDYLLWPIVLKTP